MSTEPKKYQKPFPLDIDRMYPRRWGGKFSAAAKKRARRKKAKTLISPDILPQVEPALLQEFDASHTDLFNADNSPRLLLEQQ